MKAITIRQPWVGAIFSPTSPKDVENRTQAYSHRGLLLIHAGQNLATGDAFAKVREITGREVPVLGAPSSGREWAVGAIVGVVDLVSVHGSGECGCDCSPWALPYRKHLVLADARRFAKPVPAYGKQGLWTPDPETMGPVREQLERAGLAVSL
jgi:hypothetical protein